MLYEESIKNLFKFFDSDNSNSISINELMAVFHDLNKMDLEKEQ